MNTVIRQPIVNGTLKANFIFNVAFLLFCHISTEAQIIKSNLPIVVIETKGSPIYDDVKSTADLKIIDPPSYYQTDKDLPNIYAGKIGIELRGSSSQSFPKRAYSFETRLDNGEDRDVSLFGWPEEADYILYPSYHEKSLMHNVLAMEIYRAMGFYASRTRFVEVILDNNYQGVYVVMEKIKRGEGRVDISKLEPEEISGDDLTGGYIVKIDKQTGSQNGGWLSNYYSLSSQPRGIYFQYDYPDDAPAQQRSYIKDYVSSFESSLKSPLFKDSQNGYRKWVNLESFIHYWILNEVSRNVDGYRLSTFLYKDKESKGGKLTIGPPWDYDISFGNADYCQGQSYQGFSWNFNSICPEDGFHLPFWWDKFLQDSFFVDSLSKTYDFHRKQGVLRQEFLFGLIDSMKMELEEAQIRNFNKWNILGQYVWPNPYPIPSSWQGEVQELKNWLSNRLIWLDNNIPRNKTPITEVTQIQVLLVNHNVENKYSLKIQQPYPNKLKCRLIDLNGRILDKAELWLDATNVEIFLDDIIVSSQLSQGLSILEVEIGEYRKLYKIIRL